MILSRRVICVKNFTLYYPFCPDYSYAGTLLEFNDENSNNYILNFDGTNINYRKNDITISTQNTTTQGIDYWFVEMQPTQAVFRFIVTTELYPSETLYPSDTLYPLTVEEE
jgi:hypothetical protein